MVLSLQGHEGASRAIVADTKQKSPGFVVPGSSIFRVVAVALPPVTPGVVDEGTVQGQHTYTSPGQYLISVTVSDEFFSGPGESDQ